MITASGQETWTGVKYTGFVRGVVFCNSFERGLGVNALRGQDGYLIGGWALLVDETSRWASARVIYNIHPAPRGNQTYVDLKAAMLEFQSLPIEVGCEGTYHAQS